MRHPSRFTCQPVSACGLAQPGEHRIQILVFCARWAQPRLLWGEFAPQIRRFRPSASDYKPYNLFLILQSAISPVSTSTAALLTRPACELIPFAS